MRIEVSWKHEEAMASLRKEGWSTKTTALYNEWVQMVLRSVLQ